MIDVNATKITKSKIFYECPFCFTNKSRTRTYPTNILKNGKTAINRIPTIHHHGNEMEETSTVSWNTYRSSHCCHNRESVHIFITDETIRL